MPSEFHQAAPSPCVPLWIGHPDAGRTVSDGSSQIDHPGWSIPDGPSLVGRISGCTLPVRIIPDGASRMDCPGAPSRMDHRVWTIPIGPCRRLPFQMGGCDVESVPEDPTMVHETMASSNPRVPQWRRSCQVSHDARIVHAGNLHDGDNHVRRASRRRAECWRDHARIQK